MQSNYQRWKIWFEARKCNEQKLVVRYKLFNNDDNLTKLGPPKYEDSIQLIFKRKHRETSCII